VSARLPFGALGVAVSITMFLTFVVTVIVVDHLALGILRFDVFKRFRWYKIFVLKTMGMQ
jgi:hypothetical protein